jgi:hypothetical protein
MVRTMSARRLASVLCVVLIASATAVIAQPKKGGAPAPAKEPAPTGMEKAPAPAPAPAPAAGSADPAAAGSGAGSAVEMAEDPPPSDMEGTNENPDAPRIIGEENKGGVPAAPPVLKKSGYPIEEVFRPITLPANMSEIGIEMHAAVSPYAGASSLRARYGITRQVQLGLTYLMAGIFAEEDFVVGSSAGTKVHPGKAVGLDVTILAQNWIGIRVGVPVYIDPVAVGLTLGAPLKFVFGDKVAIGGLDDLLSIKLSRFAPSFYQEATNVGLARASETNSVISKGFLRFSGFGTYQHKPNMAFVGRIGVTMDDFSSTKSNAGGGLTTFLRVGLQYTAKKRIDIGGSLGFDNLARGGTFGPQVFINVRI